MKFEIITVGQFNKDHGTSWKDPMSSYVGEIPGMCIGVTPEVRMADGSLDSESTTFIHTIDELNDDFWEWHRNDMSYKYKWTGRLVFRGYYSAHYDYEERDEYFKEERV